MAKARQQHLDPKDGKIAELQQTLANLSERLEFELKAVLESGKFFKLLSEYAVVLKTAKTKEELELLGSNIAFASNEAKDLQHRLLQMIVKINEAIDARSRLENLEG